MPDNSILTLNSKDEAYTQLVAEAVALHSRRGDIITLSGEIGAGKTVFARGFIKALGCEEEIPSPTFTLVQVYPLRPNTVNHIDLYRLNQGDEIFELGVEELFDQGISLIEWPDRLGEYLPQKRLCITIRHPEKNKFPNDNRSIIIEAIGNWQRRLEEVAKKLKYD